MARSFYTTHSGALFVSPGGQSEQGSAVRAAGYSWGAINVADGHPVEDWGETIRQFEAAGMRVPVWGRIENTSIEQIMMQAIQHRRPCILNIEDEFKAPAAAKWIEDEILRIKKEHPTWTREVVINTVGWLYNGVDYTPVAHRPVQLQTLAQDMHIAPGDLPHVVDDCLWHARMKGFRDMSVCFQTYAGATPDWYSFYQRARALIWGDVVGAAQAWPQWKVIL